jgi:hypothetical protein
MRLIGVISTAVLSLSLGATVPGYAQQEQHDQQEDKNDKPAQEKEKKAQPEKSVKPEEKNTQQPEKSVKPEERNTQQREQSAKPEERNAQQEQKNAKPEERNAQQQAQPERQEQRGGGGRIPAERYQANFGREHSFRVSQGDYSNHRFEYGGYSFAFVDAWPSNWLYTQDVFVVELNGMYYLCNPMYPGVNIAISVMP